MLTTTLDGLWALQVLTGIEVLAPELGLRPHLPSIETPAMALAHPVVDELRAAGVIDDADAVEPSVREWLTVLSRRDIALLLHVQTPTAVESERVLMARFAHWWVSLQRYQNQVRISGIGSATSEQEAGLLINTQIEQLCGRLDAAVLKPVTLDSAALIDTVRHGGGMANHLRSAGIDPDQAAVLTMAADAEHSAQASVVAIQSGVTEGPARCHIQPQTVTVIDTPQGRLISEHVVHQGKNWMIVGPGSADNIASAVLKLMRQLPAQHDWFSHRKAV